MLSQRRSYRLANDSLHSLKIQEALDKGCKRISQICTYTGLGRTTVERLLVRLQRTDILPKGARERRPQRHATLTPEQVNAIFEELGPEPGVIEFRVLARTKYGVELLDTTIYRWLRNVNEGQPALQGRSTHSRTPLLTNRDIHKLAEDFADDPHFTIPQLIVAMKIRHPDLTMSRQSLYNYSRRIKSLAMDLHWARKDQDPHNEVPVL